MAFYRKSFDILNIVNMYDEYKCEHKLINRIGQGSRMPHFSND